MQSAFDVRVPLQTTDESFWNNKIVTVLLMIIAGAVTIYPIIRLVIILTQSGENNPSNDEVMYVEAIRKALVDDFSLKEIFAASSRNDGHIIFFPLLLMVGAAAAFDFNVYVLLGLGITFGVLTLLFVHLSLVRPISQFLARLFFLPIFSWLIFSVSQISIFEFDFIAIQQNLAFLGFVIGVWALGAFRNQWAGVLVMVGSGILASWSYGGGVLVWPLFLLGLLCYDFRKKRFYLIWGVGLFLALFPYYQFFKTKIKSGDKALFSRDPWSLIQGIGLPMVDDFFTPNLQTNTMIRGMVGLMFLIIGLGIVWNLPGRFRAKDLAAPFLFLAYGILNILLIAMFRSAFGAWYTKGFMFFWIGLAGLAMVFLCSPSIKGVRSVLGKAWGAGVILCLIIFLVRSNLHFENKSVFMQTRSPVANSCLRNYKVAPTYCGESLFTFEWGVGGHYLLSLLAPPLAKSGLSVFSSRQRWSLQGDFILGNVEIHEAPKIPDVHWVADSTSQAVSFMDYRRLNVFLHSPNSIDWKISLPKNLNKAELKTAIAISPSAPHYASSDGVIFQILIASEGGDWRVLYSKAVGSEDRKWHPVNLDLSQFSGQRIAIKFGSHPGENPIYDWAMYRHPYIDLVLEGPSGSVIEAQSMTPENTDLFEQLPKRSADDFILDPADPNLWTYHEMSLFQQGNSQQPTTWIMGQNPQMIQKKAMSLCLSEYSHFTIRLAASEKIVDHQHDAYFRKTKVFFKVAGQDGFPVSFAIPLLNDGKIHEYTYDLKLLELSQNLRLTGLKIAPVVAGNSSTDNSVKLVDLGFIAKSEAVKCL